jgi:hypothetical protein
MSYMGWDNGEKDSIMVQYRPKGHGTKKKPKNQIKTKKNQKQNPKRRGSGGNGAATLHG